MKTKVQNPNAHTALYQAILRLKSEEECRVFLRAMCTEHEIDSMAQRLEVMKDLMDGKTYTEIENLTTVSTATISRASRVLSSNVELFDEILKQEKK